MSACRLHDADVQLYDALESIFLSVEKHHIPLETSYVHAKRFIPERGLAIRRAIQRWRKIYDVLDSSRSGQSMPYDTDRVDRLVNIAMDRDMVRDLVHPLAGSHGLRRVACHPANVYMWQGSYSSTVLMTWVALYTKSSTWQRFLDHCNQNFSWLVYSYVRPIAYFIRPSPVPYVWTYEDNNEGKNHDWFRKWDHHMCLPLSLTPTQRDNILMMCTMEWQPIAIERFSEQQVKFMSNQCRPENKWWPEMAVAVAMFDDAELIRRFFADPYLRGCLIKHRGDIAATMRLVLQEYLAGDLTIDSTCATLQCLSEVVLNSGEFVPHLNYYTQRHIVISCYNSQPNKQVLSAIKYSRALQPLLDITSTHGLREFMNDHLPDQTLAKCIANELCWRAIVRKGATLLPRQEGMILELANVLSANEVIVEIMMMETGWHSQNHVLQSKLKTLIRQRVRHLTRVPDVLNM